MSEPPDPALPAPDSSHVCHEALSRIRETNHAIGNALVGIMGYAELTLMQLDDSQPLLVSRLRSLTEAAQRVDQLSQEISAIIRGVLPRAGSSEP